MARKKSATLAAEPEGWAISEVFTANGRHVQKGTELTIAGERGRFRFMRHVQTADGAEWLDVFGGVQGHERTRAFRPERVKRVHRLARTRANLK